ncbi:MAG: NADH:ubiquinone reductase (Na(+)-transporting) subunit F, partial [Gammaproteobacteria bacterium]
MNTLLENEIFLGILVFTIAVNTMVLIILGARRLLVSTGDITIEMNDSAKSVVVQAGGKLLQTLASQNLFLSSACG